MYANLEEAMKDPGFASDVENRQIMVSDFNGQQIRNYNDEMTSYKMQLGQYAPGGQQVKPVRPTPPMLQTFSPLLYLQAVNDYGQSYQDGYGDGSGPSGEINATVAYNMRQYVPTPDPATVPVVATQPANPIGAAEGGGFFAPAPGDKTPDGKEYTGSDGTKYVKHVRELFGTAQVWWQVVN